MDFRELKTRRIKREGGLFQTGRKICSAHGTTMVDGHFDASALFSDGHCLDILP